MSTGQEDGLKVELIPIDQITVINPRDRGQGKFAQIVESIEKLGLKKPIRVCRRTARDGTVRYDLVCGQGRLEAYKALGQTDVPAIVVEISRKELLLQSLVENLARRKYNAIDLASQITDLEDRGYTCEQIAQKTNLGSDYVRGIVRLLRKGESRLIKAVEAGQIPITIAITIASSDDADVQRALADAYENKSLRGKEINLAMRSAEAAKNTSGLIEESVGKAKNGVTIAQTVATNLTQINDAATRVSALIAEIAAAGREQATGIDQISQAVGQMDKVTQTNAANAEETAAASEELNAQAEQLQGCVRDLQALVGLEQSAQHRAAPPMRLRQHVNTNSHSVSKSSSPKSTGRELIPLESAQETRSDFSEFSKAA